MLDMESALRSVDGRKPIEAAFFGQFDAAHTSLTRVAPEAASARWVRQRTELFTSTGDPVCKWRGATSPQRSRCKEGLQ
jgi:hypothetical protein